MITFSNEEFIREKYGDDPASNPNLKPLIDSEELESKLNGFYIITESNIYPIKRCAKQRNGTLTNLADLFEDCGYKYSQCHCDGNRPLDYSVEEQRCGNVSGPGSYFFHLDLN